MKWANKMKNLDFRQKVQKSDPKATTSTNFWAKKRERERAIEHLKRKKKLKRNKIKSDDQKVVNRRRTPFEKFYFHLLLFAEKEQRKIRKKITVILKYIYFFSSSLSLRWAVCVCNLIRSCDYIMAAKRTTHKKRNENRKNGELKNEYLCCAWWIFAIRWNENENENIVKVMRQS